MDVGGHLGLNMTRNRTGELLCYQWAGKEKVHILQPPCRPPSRIVPPGNRKEPQPLLLAGHRSGLPFIGESLHYQSI